MIIIVVIIEAVVVITTGDRQQISVTVNINGRETVLSSDLRLTASYETDKGDLRVIEKIIQLPLRMFVRICSPENTTTFSATFKPSNPLLNFSQLFPGTVQI